MLRLRFNLFLAMFESMHFGKSYIFMGAHVKNTGWYEMIKEIDQIVADAGQKSIFNRHFSFVI